MIRRGVRSVLFNTKATLPLPVCELISNAILWKENSNSGKICRGFFPQHRKEKCKKRLLEVSQVGLWVREIFVWNKQVVSLFHSKWNLKSNYITHFMVFCCKRKACIEWDWSKKAVICKVITLGFWLFQTDQLLRTASQHSDSSGFAEDSADCSPFSQLQVRFSSCGWNTPD